MEGLDQQDNSQGLGKCRGGPAAALEEKSSPLGSELYTPLSTTNGEFRIVELLPSASFDAPAICEILKTNFRSHPKYEALSYVWRPPPFTSSIKLSLPKVPTSTSTSIA